VSYLCVAVFFIFRMGKIFPPRSVDPFYKILHADLQIFGFELMLHMKVNADLNSLPL